VQRGQKRRKLYAKKGGDGRRFTRIGGKAFVGKREPVGRRPQPIKNSRKLGKNRIEGGEEQGCKKAGPGKAPINGLRDAVLQKKKKAKGGGTSRRYRYAVLRSEERRDSKRKKTRLVHWCQKINSKAVITDPRGNAHITNIRGKRRGA